MFNRDAIERIIPSRPSSPAFGVHPTQVGGWKKQALACLPDIFDSGRGQVRQRSVAEKDELYKQIGQLKVELDFRW